MIPNQANAVQRLQAQGGHQHLRFPSPQLNKESLCQLCDEELARLGLARVTTEHFAYEIFPMETLRSPRHSGPRLQARLNTPTYGMDRSRRDRGCQGTARWAQAGVA